MLSDETAPKTKHATHHNNQKQQISVQSQVSNRKESSPD